VPGLTTTATEPVAPVAAPERPRSLTADVLPYLAVVGVAAALTCLYLTRRAPGLAPDSVVYLGTAHNLATGRGLTTPFNLMFNPYPPARAVSFHGDIPLTQYPPLFPIVLGMLGWMGAGLVDAARALNAALFGINMVLVGLLMARVTRSRLLGVLGAVAFTLSANVLINHGLVMSEPLMLTALLGGILLLPWLLREPRAAPLLSVGACAGAASLTRLAGVSFTLAAVVAVLLWMTRPTGVRVRYAVGVFALGVGPVALWALVTRLVSPSGDVRPIGFHPPGWRQFDTAVDTASGWLIGLGADRSVRVVLLAVILVVCVAAGVMIASERPPADADVGAERSGAARQRANGREPGIPARSERAMEQDVRRLLGILALFVAGYLLMVILTNVFLDASTSLEGRLLLPVQVTGGVLVLGLVHRSLVLRAGARIAAVVVVVLMVWSAWPTRAIVRPFGSVSTVSALDDSFPARVRSSLAEAVRKLPPDALLASNVPANVFYDTGRDSIFLPPKQYLVAGERNHDFGAQADELGRIFAARHGYIALYADFSTALPSAADLGKHMQLVEVGRFRDGVLYRVESRT
jgi:hypothetical protein